MKKLFIMAASVALASASADAADMAARPYTKAPPPAIAAVYDWSGFYVGANAGYATSRNCWNFESFAGAPFTAGQGCHDADGAVAVDRSVIVGSQPLSCSAWKHKAIGPICKVQASPPRHSSSRQVI